MAGDNFIARMDEQGLGTDEFPLSDEEIYRMEEAFDAGWALALKLVAEVREDEEGK